MITRSKKWSKQMKKLDKKSLKEVNGVDEAGFKITLLPAAIAGATLCATRFKGKLKGVIAAIMPIGTRI